MIFAIPLVYVWRVNGIAPSLIAISATGLAASWWYARRVRVEAVDLTWKETWAEAKPLTRLGVVFMSTSLMTTVSGYAMRLFVARKLGLRRSAFIRQVRGSPLFTSGRFSQP